MKVINGSVMNLPVKANWFKSKMVSDGFSLKIASCESNFDYDSTYSYCSELCLKSYLNYLPFLPLKFSFDIFSIKSRVEVEADTNKYTIEVRGVNNLR